MTPSSLDDNDDYCIRFFSVAVVVLVRKLIVNINSHHHHDQYFFKKNDISIFKYDHFQNETTFLLLLLFR